MPEKKIIIVWAISCLLLLFTGIFIGHISTRGNLDHLRAKLVESNGLNQRFSTIQDELGKPIEEIPGLIEQLRTELQLAQDSHNRIVESIRKEEQRYQESIGEIGSITEALRAENQRAIEIVRELQAGK